MKQFFGDAGAETETPEVKRAIELFRDPAQMLPHTPRCESILAVERADPRFAIAAQQQPRGQQTGAAHSPTALPPSPPPSPPGGAGPTLLRLQRLLGISANACDAEIRRTYLEQIKRLHPDATGGVGPAQPFVELQSAWESYRQTVGANLSQGSFTAFAVGCSFADSDEERAERERVMQAAALGGFERVQSVLEQPQTTTRRADDGSPWPANHGEPPPPSTST